MDETDQSARKRIPEKTATIAIRVTPADRAEIIRRADERGITLTQYLTDAGLDRLEDFSDSVDARLAQHDSRLARLERLAFDTGA